MSKVIETVTKLAEQVVIKHDCSLWDIEFVKEGGEQYLRVFIDRDEGVSIALCEAVSRELDPLLDEIEDKIPGAYTFEVSSAGVERRLSKATDFERFMGHLAEVKLYKNRNGKKSYIGHLAGYQEGNVELDIDGEKNIFEKSEIATVRLRVL